MRNFLKQLNIVGGVNVWSEGDMCKYAIDNLLKWCDKVVIMMDNSDEYTTNIIVDYVEQYPKRIVIGKTDILPALVGQSVARRHKLNSARLSECLLNLVRSEHYKRPIDIFLFLNSDEIYTNSLPDVLDKFVNSTLDTVFIRPIEVYESMNIIINRGLIPHARIYKYTPKLTAIPPHKTFETADGIATRDYWFPYKLKRNIMRADYTFVHLQRLTKKNRELRLKAKGGVAVKGTKLWRVSKPAYELTPEEGLSIYTKEYLDEAHYKEDINNIPLAL